MLNDELISAYLDEELDAERRAMVERHLLLDRAAGARFERLRAADDLLIQAFLVADQSKDEFFTEMIGLGEHRRQRAWPVGVAAFAAAVVLGLLVGQYVRVGGANDAFAITAQQARLLDTQVSGRVTNTDAGAFEIVLSLRSDNGNVCRQFRLTRDLQSTDVLVCRDGESNWRMVAAAGAAEVEGYVPAGADTPLDAAIRNLGAVETLDQSQERALIAREWH